MRHHLDGEDGDDSLFDLGSDDVLIGGAGADYLSGDATVVSVRRCQVRPMRASYSAM
ncbi:hypothetical protein [Paucibacter sp. PLA-PC-4]|uniref:hypothetical protein n=1 Tax=Paucibacter sp. PLA-PC-4 TaxID=2993655 RepID=UPI003A4C52C3